MSRIILPILVSLLVLTEVHSVGQRTFGELCSFGGHITSFFNRDREERTCDSDKGLICTGTCSCPPARVWDVSLTFFGGSVETGKGCLIGAGRSCFGGNRNEQCVSNAQCHFAICRCKPRYKANGAHCVNVVENDPVNADLPASFVDFGGSNNNSSNDDNNSGSVQEDPANHIRPSSFFHDYTPVSHVRPSSFLHEDSSLNQDRPYPILQQDNNYPINHIPSSPVRTSSGGGSRGGAIRFE